jgi:hypothetical protein
MIDDSRLMTIYRTGNRAIIAVIKSILDNAEIQYAVIGESNYKRRMIEIQIDEKDEPMARELLSEIKE